MSVFAGFVKPFSPNHQPFHHLVTYWSEYSKTWSGWLWTNLSFKTSLMIFPIKVKGNYIYIYIANLFLGAYRVKINVNVNVFKAMSMSCICFCNATVRHIPHSLKIKIKIQVDMLSLYPKIEREKTLLIFATPFCLHCLWQLTHFVLAYP